MPKRYENPWPNSESHSFATVLRWMRERRGQTFAPTPPRGSFPTATPEVIHPRGAADDFRATWIGHSTVLLQLAGLNVITDPVFSQRASPVQWAGPRRVMDAALTIDALPPLDVVLLSHNHYDHLDRPAVKRIARSHPGAIWIVAAGLGHYIKPWGARNIVELEWWQQVRFDRFTVTATPARHFSNRRLGDRNRSLWCGFVFETSGHRLFFAADTGFHPQFPEVGARLGPFDFTMIPIGAYDPRWFMERVHVDPEQAVQIYQDLASAHPSAPPPLMLALHWGTFRLTDEPMDEPPQRALARWRAVNLPEELLWVARFGETRRIPKR